MTAETRATRDTRDTRETSAGQAVSPVAAKAGVQRGAVPDFAEASIDAVESQK